MPLDPNIALSGVVPKLNTPFENLNQVLNIRNQQLAGQERQARVKEIERQAANEQKIQAIWTENQDDPETAIKLTRQIDPKYAYEITKAVGDGRKAWAQGIEAETTNQIAKVSRLIGALQAIDPTDKVAYQHFRQQAVQEDPNTDQILPPEYDAQRLQAALQYGMEAKDIATINRDWAKGIAKGEYDGIAEGFAVAKTPEEWAAKYADARAAFVPAAVLAPFKTFNPEMARDLALGAKGRADVRHQEAGIRVQERGQDISAATQMRGQDISAATQRRGQDIVDARAKAGVGAEGLKLSAGQQQELEAMLTISDMAQDVNTLGREIKWSGVGSFGRGTMADYAARLGKGTAQEKSLRNKINNMKATIAKLRGGTAFTPNEQRLLESYAPDINDADEVIEQKLVDLQDFVEKKRANMLKIASGDLSPNAPRTAVPAAPAAGGATPTRMKFDQHGRRVK